MSKNKNLYAVILCGGVGTRFWPLSRRANPKQFLSMMGTKSLLQETLIRIQPLVPNSNIIVISNQMYQRKIRQISDEFNIPRANILLEPEGKNTAPAIGWAAAHIRRINAQAVMMVLPSDHTILKPKVFLNILKQAVTLAADRHVVTLGIVPDRPETGYGYLKTKKVSHKGRTLFHVEKFIEKPDQPKAVRFFKSGNYWWNSGMFIWRCDVIGEAFKQHLPEVDRYFTCHKNNGQIRKHWSKLPNISIDYGILEKVKGAVALGAQAIGWSDLGSWQALTDILKKDKQQNVLKGNVVQLKCRNTAVFSQKRLVAAIGLEDIIIVDTQDALLVCRKEDSQDVKNIVAGLDSNQK